MKFYKIDIKFYLKIKKNFEKKKNKLWRVGGEEHLLILYKNILELIIKRLNIILKTKKNYYDLKGVCFYGRIVFSNKKS